MKASDYIAEFLATNGVTHVFGLTGAHILHLIDSIAQHPGLTFVPCLHEQGAAFAADAYARISGKPGVVLSTSGPGAVNLLSGVCAAYFDSIPLLILTGQVASNQRKDGMQIRQRGFQETDVEAIFRTVVKSAWRADAANLWRILHWASPEMLRERGGPILIDLADDVQRAVLPEEPLPIPCSRVIDRLPNRDDPVNLEPVWEAFRHAERPLIIMGAGIRLADCQEEAQRFIDRLQIPALFTWGGMDLLPSDHPLNMGGFGTCGPKAGNVTISQADVILVLGARITNQYTGGQPFAPQARKFLVDIDPAELARFAQEWQHGEYLCADVGTVLSGLPDSCLANETTELYRHGWRIEIAAWRKQWPVGRGCIVSGANGLNPYEFIAALSDAAGEGDIIITDAGATLCWTMQTWKVKPGQRIISAWNHSPMGYAVPAAVGASLAAPGRRIIVLTGDGSFQMNAQELATIKRLGLNVHIFVLANDGYGIIRQTQDAWLEGRHMASAHDLRLPSAGDLAYACDIPRRGLISLVGAAPLLAGHGPVLTDVAIDPLARIVPKLKPGQKTEEID